MHMHSFMFSVHILQPKNRLRHQMERRICYLFLLLPLCIGLLAADSASGHPDERGNAGEFTASITEIKNHKHSGFSPAECPDACSFRCSKTAFHKPCMFYCQECCFKCKCVPTGTYDHKERCACYNNWKTKRGGPKCP